MKKNIFFLKYQMMQCIKIFLFLFLSISLGVSVFGQNEQVAHRVFMFGNLCEVDKDSAFLKDLETTFKNKTEPYTFLLNGDLTNAAIDSKKGAAQLEQIKTLIKIVDTTPHGKIILWAGDRDWNKNKRGGQKAFKKLEKAVSQHSLK